MKIRLSDWVRLERDGKETLYLKVRISGTREEWDGLGAASMAGPLSECVGGLPRSSDQAGDNGLWTDDDGGALGFPTSEGYSVHRSFAELLATCQGAVLFKRDDWVARLTTGEVLYEEDVLIG